MKIGFLPLYIALYDEVNVPRARLENFYEAMACGFEAKGIEVMRTPICRLEAEFKEAVAGYEAAGADVIVTWHAAYSPSLESIEVLANTALPIVVMDTTETYDFSPTQAPGEVSWCHGIHGVMDMCNMLARRGKAYAIAAGHYPNSDVLDRVVGYVKAAVAATSLAGSTVGQVGQSFPGMGDFLISDEELASRFGVTVLHAEANELRALQAEVTDEEIAAEMAADLDGATLLSEVPADVHTMSTRTCLGIRKWLEKHNLDAFTVDFMDIAPEMGLDTMPFMEACKAMARGIGYAGEGDILTAAITGALLRGFGDTSFVEIFCPDWKNNTLFLSHMGEINYGLIDTPVEMKELNFIYGKNAKNPIVGYGRFKAGKAVFANLFDTPTGYKLLVAPVTMEAPVEGDNFVGRNRGWMRPEMTTDAFLEALSRAGATHHSVLVYNTTPEAIAFFGKLIGAEVIRL